MMIKWKFDAQWNRFDVRSGKLPWNPYIHTGAHISTRISGIYVFHTIVYFIFLFIHRIGWVACALASISLIKFKAQPKLNIFSINRTTNESGRQKKISIFPFLVAICHFSFINRSYLFASYLTEENIKRPESGFNFSCSCSKNSVLLLLLLLLFNRSRTLNLAHVRQ